MSGSRSRALDLARALAILSMVAYHFSYDWFVVLGGDGGWPGRWYIHLWQQSICWTFILVWRLRFCCSPPPTIFKAAGLAGRGWGFSCPPSGTRARCW